MERSLQDVYLHISPRWMIASSQSTGLHTYTASMPRRLVLSTVIHTYGTVLYIRHYTILYVGLAIPRRLILIPSRYGMMRGFITILRFEIWDGFDDLESVWYMLYSLRKNVCFSFLS